MQKNCTSFIFVHFNRHTPLNSPIFKLFACGVIIYAFVILTNFFFLTKFFPKKNQERYQVSNSLDPDQDRFLPWAQTVCKGCQQTRKLVSIARKECKTAKYRLHILILVGWFCCFTSQVNSYGHCGTVSSPNHTFSWAGLNKRLTSNSCTYFRL